MTTSGGQSAQVDAEALRRVLSDALRGPLTVARMESLSGGASAETCAVDVVDGAGVAHELILRRSAAAGSNVFNPGVGEREEALVQQAARRAGVPAVEVVAVFDDDASLGSGYVMRRLEGEVIARKLLRDARYAAARAGVVDDCARALAAIHSVPLGDLPELPALPPADHLDRLASLHDAFGQAIPTFTLAFRWLRERLPAARPLTLVHGDFRTGNLLVDEQGLVAVLDWELMHLGDPLEDLGWFCTPAWRFGSELPAGGFGSREQLAASYAREMGAEIDAAQIRYWEVFGTLRWGVICQAQAFAHLNGIARSVERAAIGRRTTEVELDLLLLLQGKL
jgi:aminoglycoside phosphotransferase (APT) family kinase protein